MQQRESVLFPHYLVIKVNVLHVPGTKPHLSAANVYGQLCVKFCSKQALWIISLSLHGTVKLVLLLHILSHRS